MLHDLAGDVVQLGRHRVHLGPDHRTRLVHKVNRLIRQEPVGDVTVGKYRRPDQRLILNFHPMKHLVPLFQTAQNRNGVLHRRLRHHHRLKPTLERRVFLDILPVLVEGGRADTVQLAAGQHGLEQVARIHAAFGLARTYNGMQLVDKQDDPAFALPDLL